MMPTQTAYLLALTRLEGVGPIGAVNIAKRFGSPEELLGASASELETALGERHARSVLSHRNGAWDSLLVQCQTRIDEHLRCGIRPIAFTEDEYPPLLRHIPDPPPILYAKGNIDVLRVLDVVAIVGTRDATENGLKVANRIARFFASSKFVVVSGLAKGIDTSAHQAALEAGITIAVLANPLDRVYPAENRSLAEAIVARGGTLVSELGLGEQTFRNAFVRRDRIQSGMSLAVVPIQTDIEGGTMHTVRFAEDQKRLLFCPNPLPSEGNRKQYAGIWYLIRTKRATAFDSKHYSETTDKIRQYKVDLIRRHGLTDVPFPSVVQQQLFEVKLEVSKATQGEELALQRLERLARELGLHESKEQFSATITKLRNRFFKRPRLSKKASHAATVSPPDDDSKVPFHDDL